MKKTILSVGLGLVALAMLPSCGGDGEKQQSSKPGTVSKNKTPVAASQDAQGNSLNIRFIDTDSIGLKYNLAIDFNEQMVKMQSNLEDEEKKQRTSLQSQATALQNKYKNAQSQAEADKINAEAQSLQNASAQAEQKLGQMAADMEKTLAANAKTMQDSLTNFLRDYAAENGYDAIIVSSAAPYYNPDLDITAEVIEGLNARYNKVKKK